MSNDSDSDEEKRLTKKLKMHNTCSIPLLLEKFKSSTPSSLNYRRNSSIVEDKQNYDTMQMTMLYNLDGQTLDDIQSESEDSSLENNYNMDNDCESDDYVPISDSEFELVKCITNNEINDNHNAGVESTKNDKYVNDAFEKSTELDNDELYDLLDKVYQEKNKNPDENKKKGVTKDDFKEYEKIVLEEVCKNHFDILPENWIEATHKSGMPVYLHKKSRVVTITRPYFLGPGDPKSHLAPLSAITCLQYRKSIESKKHIKSEPDFQVSKLGDMIIPNAKVETAQENIIKESLTHEELREYCEQLFK